MAAGHKIPNPANSRTIDKILGDAQNTGCLDLSNRRIHEFPKAAEIYDLADTVEADISKNRFTEVPAEICEFLHLEELRCYHNAIKSIPPCIRGLRHLSFLDLSRNQFTNLPPFLCELTSLEVLIISNNKLYSIPEEIGNLSSLMELDVSDNQIDAIPSQIADIRQLKILNLRKNQLSQLPPELSKLKLKSLDFSCNKIQSIPLEYRNMETLEELILDNNPLINPPAHKCTKGRVHILKDLHILAIREDKRRGVLSEPAFSRNALRRSYQKEDLEAARLRRKQIVSTDSGYITDPNHRWPIGTPGSAGENGLDSAVKAAESLKEQRAERHLELKSRITGAELRSPGSSVITPTDGESGDPPSGSISPLRLSANNFDNSTDMFSRQAIQQTGMYQQELQRQKQEYEKKKRRAEQLKTDGARRSSKPPVPRTPNTPSPQAPVAPIRPASGHSESGIVHGYNGRLPHAASTPYYNICPHQSKGESNNCNLEAKSTAAVSSDNVMDKSTSDSHRSSPISLSSQDGDSRISMTSSVASSSAAELGSINRPSAHSEGKHKSLADAELRRSSSATLTSAEKAMTNSSRQPKSPPGPGFQPVIPISRRSANSSPAVSRSEQESHNRTLNTGDEAQFINTIREIIESRLKVSLPHDVMGELRDGVVLCHLANFIRPRTVSQIHVKSNAVPKLSMAKCRRNVENFIEACKHLGVPQEEICSQADIIDDKSPVAVLRTLTAVRDLKLSKRTSQTAGGRPTTPRSKQTLNNGQNKPPHNSTRSMVKSRTAQPLHSVV
ncbi:leucine-rich repeat and calponin homology domain-containing protein 1-like isoform X3 [Watersipora subatra]|uniref:leucine-rich repeat and calponin homology domain-containing protein 1-like isoform X3 n=1 Tax=Watersipora subatra TaxID=2589382 RepID=UPI00355C48C4